MGDQAVLERILNGDEEPTVLPFALLQRITNDFSEERKIGQGGFGEVYKGVYNGEEIAVKLFYDLLAPDNKQFENECVNLLRIRHPNIVRLLGYCYEKRHKFREYNGELRSIQYISRILCFEYLQGGSLDKYLNESRDHDWPTRYNIIEGTCEGLDFLHMGCGSPILHLDLKPGNILLDKYMGAKVADFGLSRFFGKTHTHVTNTTTGTEDYMPPEFRFKNQISPKNDVYSLGIIIIEIMAGRVGYSKFREMDDVKPFAEQVTTNWREWINATTSPFPAAELDQVETCIKIAIRCVDPERKNRPTVAEILDTLQETEKRFLEEWRNHAGFLVGQSLPTPTKSGPRGGCGGEVVDIKQDPWRLHSLTISYQGLIDAFSFSYIDQSGKKQRVGPWGEECSYHKTETIRFSPSEFVEEVRGEYGSHFENILVTSITFVTNIRTYGPFGNSHHQNVAATPFRFMADEGSSIVGFHGRSGSHLFSIGVYMSLPTPTKSGPRGGSGGKVVDEVGLMVVYEPTKPQENGKSREDPNMPAEEVPEAKRRKIVEPPSGKGKLGSSEKGKDASKNIDSSAQGQCAQQTEQRNLHPPQSFSCHYPTNKTYLGEGSRAVDVARGAMGSLLDKLGKLVKEDYNLERSMKRDIQSFSEDLAIIHKDLRQLEKLDRVKSWVDKVREQSYNIEDMVDSFMVHVKPNSSRSGFREIMHESVKLLENGMTTDHQIGDVIKRIKDKVQALADEQKKYNFDVKNVVANATTKANLRISAIYEHKEQLVGIKAPRDELIRLLQEDGDASKQKLKIISIVGMGGLGKTTLAKAVYDKMKAYHPKAFVPVGQNPDVETVLKDILYRIEKDFNAENLRVPRLIDELQERLKKERYFIVIDDIWDFSSWNHIKSVFPRGKCGSRVIITTRDEHVAFNCCKAEEEYVYKIKPLSDKYSRRLFFRRTFGPKKDCLDTPRKEEISIDILKKCGGMPLAINSIASLLACQPESTWEYVWKSLGALTEGNTRLEDMKQILDLSYMHLPEYLKTCLLHVCMYPEDSEIYKDDLLRQWVAEGFVSTNGGKDAEDVAGDYFQELINRCMIEPVKIDCNDEVLSCRVHDIILDLMRSKSRKENFIHVIDGSEYGTGPIRRVSFHYNDKNDMRIFETINKESLSQVRSVLLCRSSLAAYFLEKFKYVRVLHLELDNSYGLDLTGISRLFFLRYLKIACPHGGTCQLKLPNQIGELQQLETIDIQGCYVEKYPSDIVSLPWLSHLSTTRNIAGVVLPDGIDRLTSLRTLAGVHLYDSSVDNILGLGKLTNLRKLQICLFTGPEEAITARHMNALHSSISILSASLMICTFRESFPLIDVSGWSSRTLFPGDSQIRELDLEGCIFQRCPECIDQLRGLTSFSIWVREVADGVSIVARLPKLAYFSLKTCDIWREEKEESEICVVWTEEKEESVVIPGGENEEKEVAFQALKELIFHCKKAALTFEAGAMPKLEKLDIHSHFSMNHLFLPVGIQHLPTGTLKEILLEAHWDVAEVEGSHDWDYCSLEYMQLSSCVRSLWKGAFKRHHPDANIVVGLCGGNIGYDDGSWSGDEDEEELDDVDGYADEDVEELELDGQLELSGLVDLLSVFHYMFGSDEDEDEEDDGDNEATSTDSSS